MFLPHEQAEIKAKIRDRLLNAEWEDLPVKLRHEAEADASDETLKKAIAAENNGQEQEALFWWDCHETIEEGRVEEWLVLGPVGSAVAKTHKLPLTFKVFPPFSKGSLWKPLPIGAQEDSQGSIHWIWDGVLARGKITLLSAEAKAGKTTLLERFTNPSAVL